MDEPLTFAAFLERLLPIPRATVSLEEYARCHHRDLPGLSDEALAQERVRLVLRLALEPDPRVADWLRERLARLTAEQRGRQGGVPASGVPARSPRERGPQPERPAPPRLSLRRAGHDEELAL